MGISRRKRHNQTQIDKRNAEQQKATQKMPLVRRRLRKRKKRRKRK